MTAAGRSAAATVAEALRSLDAVKLGCYVSGVRGYDLGWLSLCLVVVATAPACSGSIGDREPGARGETAVDSGVERDADAPDDAAAPDLDGWVSEPLPVLPEAGPIDAGMPPMDAEQVGCGDGKLQAGEVCDDGDSEPGDGCSADCTSVERDYVCPSPGEACVSTVKCGDGRIGGREQCDDANRRQDDGCSRDCELEAGYACPAPGSFCIAAKCGDKIRAGDEACEDGDETPVDGDGCSARCKIEPGFICSQVGMRCLPTVCNDGAKQGSEACDDGNTLVGDGCTPFCEVEPDCRAGACQSRCGDGLILPNDREACDDGNAASGDGCSDTCQVEAGYVCALEQSTLPDVLSVPVTYRDFIALPGEAGARHPDFEAFHGFDISPGLVGPMLGADSKPVYTGICDEQGAPYPEAPPETGMCPWNQQTTGALTFAQWFRDVPSVNQTKVARMQLMREANGRTYAINNAAFFPWDGDANSWVGRGLELAFEEHNFGFTTEIRTYFEYRPNPDNPQVLYFSGDDDVWVFINRRLAVDIGGLHVQIERSVTLDEPTATSLGLQAGGIYEIALFHAERSTPESNFNLMLDGFVAAKSICQPKCGDGVVTTREACDDGKNDGSYGTCTAECRRAPYCGDGERQSDHEACDDGTNVTTYGANGKPGCAPGCKLSAYCGDKNVDSLAGEQCDDGENKGGYGKCAGDCRLGPRCGDRMVQPDDGEECDDGNLLGNDGCSSVCKAEGPA